MRHPEIVDQALGAALPCQASFAYAFRTAPVAADDAILGIGHSFDEPRVSSDDGLY